MARRVLVWRWGWLAPSETFIRSQFDAYSSWTPVALGAEAIASANSRREDRALFSSSVFDRVLTLVFRLWDWSPRLRSAVQEIDPDVIHAHFGGDASRVRRVARSLRKPFVVTLHGADVTARPNRSGVRGIRNRRRLLKVFRDAHLLIAVSQHIADAAVALGADADKVVVLPVGVPWAPPPSAAARNGVLFVGRFVEKKGLPDLLEAYAGLSEELRSVHPLRIVGAGPMEDAVVRKAREIGVRIEMLGLLPPSEVASLLEQAAVFAVPSHIASDGDTEGLPTVVFEAARAGTPVVGYAHAGIPEAVTHGETGLLVPERDVQGLSEQLRLVLSDADLAAALGAAARARYEQAYDVRARTRELEARYDALIAGLQNAR